MPAAAKRLDTTVPSGPSPYHRLAGRLRRQHAGKIATLVDLSAIPNIQSRIMFRSIARFIEERTLNVPLDAVPLARNILVLMASEPMAQELQARLHGLSANLEEQHQGALRVCQFDLDKQSDEFVDTARRLMEQAPAPGSTRLMPLRDEAPPDFNTLHRIIDVHRILWQANIANQCRRQKIWRLEPDTAPVPLTEEMWVSISAIEQSTGIALRDDIWLFGKATELLDQRVIAQIQSESRSLNHSISINLHLSSVISAAFQQLIVAKPADQVHHLMVEVPLVEWRTNHALSSTALHVLRRHGILLCLDNVRPEDVATLTEKEWEAADYIKFDAAAAVLDQQVTALQAPPPERVDLVRRKGIFCHCDAVETVAAGLSVGIRHFQGRALTPLLEDPDALEQLLGRKAAEGAAAALKGV